MLNMFEAGFLPEEGGWMQQPAKFIDIIQVMRSMVAYCDKVERDTDTNKKTINIGP